MRAAFLRLQVFPAKRPGRTQRRTQLVVRSEWARPDQYPRLPSWRPPWPRASISPALPITHASARYGSNAAFRHMNNRQKVSDGFSMTAIIWALLRRGLIDSLVRQRHRSLAAALRYYCRFHRKHCILHVRFASSASDYTWHHKDSLNYRVPFTASLLSVSVTHIVFYSKRHHRRCHGAASREGCGLRTVAWHLPRGDPDAHRANHREGAAPRGAARFGAYPLQLKLAEALRDRADRSSMQAQGLPFAKRVYRLREVLATIDKVRYISRTKEHR